MKKIILSLVILAITACDPINSFFPEKSKTDVVEFKGQKYLIPIPNNFCKFDENIKEEKAILDFTLRISEELNPASKDSHTITKIIGQYVNCDEKTRILDGEIVDAKKTITIGTIVSDSKSFTDYVKKVSRKQFIESETQNRSNSLDSIVQEMRNNLEKLDIKNIVNDYNLSSKRKALLIDNYEFWKNKPEIVFFDSYNDNVSSKGPYFMEMKHVDYYAMSSVTKLNDRIVFIEEAITKSKGSNKENTLKKLKEDSEKYFRKFLENNKRERSLLYSIPSNMDTDKNVVDELELDEAIVDKGKNIKSTAKLITVKFQTKDLSNSVLSNIGNYTKNSAATFLQAVPSGELIRWAPTNNYLDFVGSFETADKANVAPPSRAIFIEVENGYYVISLFAPTKKDLDSAEFNYFIQSLRKK